MAWSGLCFSFLCFLWPANLLAADLREVIQTAAAEGQNSMNAVLHDYTKARNHALDLLRMGIDSKKELQRQRKIVENFLHMTLKAIQAIHHNEILMAVKVRNAGFSEDDVDVARRVIRTALANAKMPQKIQRMRLDMDWTDAMQERYQLLQSYWSKWHYSKSAPGMMSSRDDNLIRQHNMIIERINQISRNANRISKTL